ncbi:hypothetical protein AB0J83_13140 [Actinoplanes sp. NPDC049596]|uniref:hypothetical protein n=1 Tax=unclassified Actinoplanes TaxID=2626549 RepID=UPI0034397D2D
MFATMRRKNRSRRMKNELNQGVDHFKRAATLAAQETSATVGPTLTAAVDRVQPAAVKAKDAASSGWGSAVATITPLVAAASDNVKQAGKVSKRSVKKSAKQNKKDAKKLQKRANKTLARAEKKQKKGRGSKLLGFALIGTAIGVAAAYANKRRQAAQWDEYEPAAPLTTTDRATFEPDEAQTFPSSPNGTVPEPAPKNV